MLLGGSGADFRHRYSKRRNGSDRARKVEVNIKLNIGSSSSEGYLAVTECGILLEGGKENLKSWRIELITL